MTLLLQKIELSVSVWSECECHFLEADLFFSLKPEWWTIGLFKATEAAEGKAVCDTERFINDEKNIGLFFFMASIFKSYEIMNIIMNCECY